MHNTLAVPSPAPSDRVATLWHLAWKEDSVLECAVYRVGPALELRVESATALIFCEPFELQPRAIARANALRESLKRRGWSEPALAGDGI